MPASDAPDWQTLVTVTSGGTLTDAPDWQNVVTGPGATPPVVGGGQAGPIATDFGWVGWTYPPNMITTNVIADIQAGIVFVSAVKALVSTNVQHISLVNVLVQSAPTAGHSYVGLYSYAASTSTTGTFTLLGTSASGVADTAFQTTGFWQVAMTSPVAVTAGTIYYAALLSGTGAIFEAQATNVFAQPVLNTTGFPNPPMAFTFRTPPSTTLPSTFAYVQSGANIAIVPWLAIS